ncbi:MAG: cytochrome c3 family protein [Candidatus Nitrospinota bacterium M3_3B_026]
MRHTFGRWRIGVICTALAAAFFWSGGQALAGIADTKHNLGSSNSVTGNNVSDTGEICVFCHTPHGADTNAPVPLWNKKLEVASPTYQTYASLGTSTLDAAQADIGSVSLACLSCHDGTQAMDNIINAPGSGGYDATGGGVDGLGYSWTIDDGTANANGYMIGGPVPMLGTDLRNDHPVSIQYAGGGYTYSADGTSAAGTACTSCADSDFFEPSVAQIGTTPTWWVNSSAGAGTSREKSDIMLYTRKITATGTDTGTSPAGSFAGVNEPFVECASCHDPHRSDTSTFLRMNNTGSAVCLTCHDK